MKILLISGHGAGDSGAVGNGYQEQALTRELANLVQAQLKEYCDVDMYNQSLNAYTQTKLGTFSAKGYDYVLEIHFNSFTSAAANGAEIYVTYAEEGHTLEQKILDNLSKYFANRGVKKSDFAVIKTAKNQGVSSALLETCFISNASDVAKYQANKTDIATQIVNGIVNGFGLTKIVVETPKVETPAPEQTTKTIEELAKEVVAGKWGNGSDRKTNLTNAGYDYSAIQAKVNEIMGGAPVNNLKNIDTIAQEVIKGLWGNGSDRKARLEAAGYDYSAVQKRVNELLA